MEIFFKKLIIIIYDFSFVMDKYGEVLIIVWEEEVIRYGNVLFGFVKFCREGKEFLLEFLVVMVNVFLCKRFVYLFGFIFLW